MLKFVKLVNQKSLGGDSSSTVLPDPDSQNKQNCCAYFTISDYRRFSKYSASLIIRHPMNNNEIISLKNFGMLRSCDVAELLVTTDTVD